MLISLTTDFGLEDAYVGVMKGVMASIAPDVPLVDVTHSIPAQDLRSAAYVLWNALPYFPAESVHLVVVDPGVGTSRRAIASRLPWGYVVGPDNGVFSYVWAAAPPEAIVELTNPNYLRPTMSATFHGRDVFAPVAAHLARGMALEELGDPVSDPVRLSLPALDVDDEEVRGEVLYVDHFGNAITSIGRLIWEGGLLHLDPAFGNAQSAVLRSRGVHVLANDRDVGAIRRTYGEVASGEVLALVGSEGLLELAVSHGSGAARLELKVGDPVVVQWEG
jgi:hypothetical protein